MRWLLAFILGALCGAAGAYWWLQRPAVVTAAPAPVGGAPVIIPAPVVGAAPPAQPDATAGTAGVPATGVPAAGVPAAGAEAAPGPDLQAPTVPADPAAAGMPVLPPSGIIAPPRMPGQAGASPAGTSTAATPAAGPGKLLLPVAGVQPGALRDTFGEARGAERRHEALDIMAPKGTPVLAAADGRIVKLFNSKDGGLTVYQFEPGEKYALYYAHLDRYAQGVAEGKMVRRGDPIGFVGATGNADPKAPHLHFAVFELTPEKQWWKGTPLNPYPLLQP